MLGAHRGRVPLKRDVVFVIRICERVVSRCRRIPCFGFCRSTGGEHFEADRFGAEEKLDLRRRILLPFASGKLVADLIGEPPVVLFKHYQSLAEAFLAIGFRFFDQVDDATNFGLTHSLILCFNFTREQIQGKWSFGSKSL